MECQPTSYGTPAFPEEIPGSYSGSSHGERAVAPHRLPDQEGELSQPGEAAIEQRAEGLAQPPDIPGTRGVAGFRACGDDQVAVPDQSNQDPQERRPIIAAVQAADHVAAEVI